MAESYSTSLKLTIIGAGDLAGTWGNVTNANLGTLLEQAITGVQAVGLSGSTYTLTNINGALDDARNAVLVFSGASSPCTIVCPGGSANKIYTVVNQCSVALTMTASGGSASLVIPAGMTSQVYLDGTNQTGSGIGVYSSLNGVPNSFTVTGNLTATGVTDVGNLSVTGTATAPTPTVGDNSTKIATTAFVQGNTTSAVQAVYPVGSIYTSTVSTNPATLFGFGTWVSFGAGRVMIGQDGSSFIAGATGGSADAIVVSHTHSASSSSSVSDPGHTHTIAGYTNGGGGGADSRFTLLTDPAYANNNKTSYSANTGISVSTSTSINATGSSGTNANLQPYIVVYMWNRTA
jgi:hypothetical protein